MVVSAPHGNVDEDREQDQDGRRRPERDARLFESAGALAINPTEATPLILPSNLIGANDAVEATSTYVETGPERTNAFPAPSVSLRPKAYAACLSRKPYRR